jgi:hypothetical protein
MFVGDYRQLCRSYLRICTRISVLCTFIYLRGTVKHQKCPKNHSLRLHEFF